MGRDLGGCTVGGVPDYYAVLGVPQDAADEDIKKAYRLLVQVWHPDTNRRDDAEERLKEINVAYETLISPERRDEYNSKLGAEPGAGGASGDVAPDEPASDDASRDDSHSEPEAHNIKVEPEVVNFGNLRPSSSPAEAEIILIWDGGSPSSIRPSPLRGDWWEIHDIKPQPRLGRVAFPIRAQAYDGIPGGRHTSHVDIVVDGVVHRVRLIMTVVGTPSKPSTPVSPGGYYPPPRPPATRTGGALSRDMQLLLHRAAWLLTTVAVFLISARIEFSVLHLNPTSNVLLILLAGWWNIAVVIYGLRRTFRRASRISIPYSNRPLVYSALSVLLLIVSIVVLVYRNGSSAQTSSGGQLPTTGPNWQPGSSDSGGGMPETASTVFNVSPGFAAQDASVSGPAEDNAGDGFNISLTPSLNGFTLKVRIKATYNASQFSAGTPASTLTGKSCMDIKGPPDQNGMVGVPYTEPPIGISLTDSGGTITGTLVYAAVLPGSYSFDFSCIGSNSSYSTLDVGSMTTTNVGIADGSVLGSSSNAMTVFAERKSATDTVILFGAIGGVGYLLPSSSACVIYNGPKQDPRIARSASVSVHQEKRGNGQWYEVGMLTFSLSAAQISPTGNPVYDAVFFYDCAQGKSTSDIIDQGGGVDLH